MIENVDTVERLVLKIKLLEGDLIIEEYKNASFYENDRSQSVSRILANIDSINLLLNEAEEIKGEMLEEINAKILNALSSYLIEIKKLERKMLQRGFKDWGKVGELRQVVHSIEKSNLNYDLAELLMLRRHEKDFLLRYDLKYAQLFSIQVNEFISHLYSIRQQDPLVVQTVIENTKIYHQLFKELVEIQKQIGLDQHSGLQANLNIHLDEVEGLLPDLIFELKKLGTQETNKYKNILIIFFLFQVILSLTLGYFFSNDLSKRIKRLRNFILHMADGDLPNKLKVKTNDEIAVASKALNQLHDMFGAVVAFATAIGTGNFDAKYDEKFSKGVLYDAFLKMQANLQGITARENKRAWVANQINKLNELRQYQDNEDQFFEELIKLVSKITDSNQAALFMVNNDYDEKILNLKSAFAYKRMKHIEMEVREGDGLVWQCFAEKMPIHLREIPEDYPKITSGLGETSPKSVYIAPLKAEEKVIGVIELATLNEYDETEQEFLEKLIDTLGVMIYYSVLKSDIND